MSRSPHSNHDAGLFKPLQRFLQQFLGFVLFFRRHAQRLDLQDKMRQFGIERPV